MMGGKAEENIEVPNLSNSMEGSAFQWGSAHHIWFFFPIWAHGKLPSNFLTVRCHYAQFWPMNCE